MIRMLWQGFDISDLEHAVVAIFEDIEADARQILDDISRQAVDDMYRILVNATTDTGRDREARGEGIAGRVDTGSMARDIHAALDADLDGGIVLEWGWTQNVEDYYLWQEGGTRKIGAMSALQGSYIKAREELRSRLRDMGLEVNG
jgi:hypothetical protein